MNKEEEVDFDKLFDEDLPFKPLTKGLGFHHSVKEKKEVQTSLKERSKDLEKSLQERASLIQSQKTPSQPLNMGDLAPFYQAEEKKDWDLNISKSETATKPELATATLAARFCAFIMDMIIVLSALALVFLGTLVASGISLGFIRENLSMSISNSLLPMGVLFYFFYFSFFDKTNFSSPGKKLTGLKLVSEKATGVKMSQAFLRAALTLLSFLTFGLASLLDFQGKLSDTKVVKK